MFNILKIEIKDFSLSPFFNFVKMLFEFSYIYFHAKH